MTAASPIIRTIRIGGVSTQLLLERLRDHAVRFNEAALDLFAHEGFTTAATPVDVEAVELSVADLGFPSGSPIGPVHRRAFEQGLRLCPLELGPHLRLQLLGQSEPAGGVEASRHRAPPGSITVASPPLSQDYAVPKGFYLRRMDGALWLRGYRSDADHVWSAADRLVFCGPRHPPV